MFDPSQYNWMDKGFTLPANINEKEAESVFRFVDKKDWTVAKKNLIGRYYIEHCNQLASENRLLSWKLSDDLNKEVKSWQKTSAFKKAKEIAIKQDQSKFLISGMMVVMTGTMLLYFITALVLQKFVLSFSIDAIVASIALVLLIRNLLLKYKMISRYVKKNIYLQMDVVSLILCICLKLVIPSFIDLSLIVLFTVHVLQKNRFDKVLKSIV